MSIVIHCELCEIPYRLPCLLCKKCKSCSFAFVCVCTWTSWQCIIILHSKKDKELNFDRKTSSIFHLQDTDSFLTNLYPKVADWIKFRSVRQFYGSFTKLGTIAKYESECHACIILDMMMAASVARDQNQQLW